MEVKAWNEIITIPTYGIGEPEKNPMFLEKRVYQGSSGVVYPHPVIEKILDQKEDREYNALFLENRYLKIMILPELGGRVQMAFDKIMQRHFIYYNRVIKPALVGLTGPWISGGIEFNWPQHHRPSTFEPTEWTIEENSDGSKTVWCNELEKMSRTKGMAGFTLYPDKAYLEVKVKLYNRTPLPQTFLWWANPALKVNDHYQSVFPPDVHAVFDHGRRDVSEFPIARGTYYKVDYSAGVDISRYKNIPVPTSYMAQESKYDFVGGYECYARAGMLHVANHHLSPGKKQWTWGNDDFGWAWDWNLTDDDGPYVELMCGVFTDNQPDFSWIMPYEERSFTQYFMPYRDLGMVKNATKEALVNLEFEHGEAVIKVYTTAIYFQLAICLKANGVVVRNLIVDASPENAIEKRVKIKNGLKPEDFELSVTDRDGHQLVSYRPDPPAAVTIPEPAKAALMPHEITSIEELYLTGLHLEQYRHATFNPADYYREALKRESGDSRCNNALGLLLLRKGQFAEAEHYFATAIQTLTRRNPNPYDGESYLNLGLALRFQGKDEAAYAAFYKAVWNGAVQDAAYFNLAQLAAQYQHWEEALELIDQSLIRNSHHHKARHLKAVILRKLDRRENWYQWADASLQLDAFNYGLYFEKYLAGKDSLALTKMMDLIGSNIHLYLEYAIDYAQAGLYEEAMELLIAGKSTQAKEYPMVWYAMAWVKSLKGADQLALALCEMGEQSDPDYCFPNRLEEVLMLQTAIRLLPQAPKANYYLGNFWYHVRQYPQAIACWERSRELDGNFPTVRRNLALAYYNQLGHSTEALQEMEAAFDLDPTDARVLMELDQLRKKLGMPAQERLDLLQQHPDCIEHRDDLYLEQITLLSRIGNYQQALELIMKRNFHPWEGGEGKVTGQYLFAHIELAKQAIHSGDYSLAINHLKATVEYPRNLGEGKLPGTQENDIHYWMGCAFEGLGDAAAAQKWWEKASVGLDQPSAAMFYNDQQPDQIFYQGLALLKLGQKEAADQRFQMLISYGETHCNDDFKIDYFAVSLPDLLIWNEDLKVRNEINCRYLMALGMMGMEDHIGATEQFNRVLTLDPNHTGAAIHQELVVE